MLQLLNTVNVRVSGSVFSKEIPAIVFIDTGSLCFVFFSPLLRVDMGTMKTVPEEPKKCLSELIGER